MTDQTDNILDFGPRLAARQQPERSALLNATLAELGELGDQLRRLSTQPNWRPQRWAIDSTAFHVRTAGVRQRLSAVVNQEVTGAEYPFSWTLEFDHLRSETERRLNDVQACIHTLQRSDVTPAERARNAAVFTTSKPKLLKAIGEVQQLISELLVPHGT